MCSKPLCLLHNYLCRLDDALTTLKNAFLQQKNSSNALFLSQVCFLKSTVLRVPHVYVCVQVLCTIATLLIEMEQQLVSYSDR